jgi:hypothetical protein
VKTEPDAATSPLGACLVMITENLAEIPVGDRICTLRSIGTGFPSAPIATSITWYAHFTALSILLPLILDSIPAIPYSTTVKAEPIHNTDRISIPFPPEASKRSTATSDPRRRQSKS